MIIPVYVQEEKNSGEERCDNEEAEKTKGRSGGGIAREFAKNLG